jgi:hypothetical protein
LIIISWIKSCKIDWSDCWILDDWYEINFDKLKILWIDWVWIWWNEFADERRFCLIILNLESYLEISSSSVPVSFPKYLFKICKNCWNDVEWINVSCLTWVILN